MNNDFWIKTAGIVERLYFSGRSFRSSVSAVKRAINKKTEDVKYAQANHLA